MIRSRFEILFLFFSGCLFFVDDIHSCQLSVMEFLMSRRTASTLNCLSVDDEIEVESENKSEISAPLTAFVDDGN